MAPPRKFSDADLRKHWEDTGSISETARRLKVQYNAAYDRLIRMNAIQQPAFKVDNNPHTARTIPDVTTLVVGDTQAPAHHPDTIPFTDAVDNEYKPQQVVHIGDEADLNFLSDWARLPEVDQPSSEWAAAQGFLRAFYARFPRGFSCVSNHVHGRVDKARTRGRLLPAFLKSVEELMDVPVGWSFHSELRCGDVIIRHGHKDTTGLKRIITEEIPAKYGRHYSLLIGHYHSRIGVATQDIKIGSKFFWGGFAGSLIDPSHPFFSYSKGAEKLGCVVIMHGRLIPIAMPLDEHGRWTGKLP